MVSPAATKRLNTVLKALEKRYAPLKQDLPDDFTALMMFQILELGGHEALAHRLGLFTEEYVDWNDMRVLRFVKLKTCLGDSLSGLCPEG